MRKVAIIGAGAAGMTAAITAASNGAEVVVLEHMDRVGKKILSTGNGRCNFTNTYQDRSCYHSDNESFPWKIIEKFNAEQIIKLFEELGVYAKNRNGYMYPYSDQASSVTEALKMELERLQIDVRLQTECTDIFPRKKGFTLQIVKDGKKGKIYADHVILCTGSRAFPASGSDGSGYDLAKKLGHKIIPVLPSDRLTFVPFGKSGTYSKKTSTTCLSNIIPHAPIRYSIASYGEYGFLYGRFEVKASYTSATCRIRTNIDCSLPRSPCG